MSWVLRDEAIITLLLNTGLRVAELCALDIEDVVVNPRGGKAKAASTTRCR